MASRASTEPRPGLATALASPQSGVARALPALLMSLVLVLIATVLFEALLAANVPPEAGAGLKLARNFGYVLLAALTLAQVLMSGTLRGFTRPVDVVILLLGLSLLVAGLVGGSGVVLTAQAIFVYLRGAIVFYAIRAIDPGPGFARRLLLLAGGIIMLNAVVAIVQALVGPGAYRAFGFDDLTWAATNRAQGLQSHPNHLGHLVGLMNLGLLAWFAVDRRIRLAWWGIFAVGAFALAASQSRESVLGVLAGVAVLIVIRRRSLKPLALGTLILVGFVGVFWVANASNFAELTRRITGVISAIEVPSGSEGSFCTPGTEGCTAAGLPKREIRVLYLQQGIALWRQRPLFGYGVGQFGGSVASESDPQWYLDPRFGPDGFDMHGFAARQVDSFWLHLLVETGAVGTLAYLSWLALLGAPFFGGVIRRPMPRPSPDDRVWRDALGGAAAAGLAFTAVVAVFSPALEDPMFPPLLFALVGLAWVSGRRVGPDVTQAHVETGS